MKGLKTFLSAAFFAICQVTVASNVVDLHPANFDEIVLKSGKPALVEFFAVSELCSIDFSNHS